MVVSSPHAHGVDDVGTQHPDKRVAVQTERLYPRQGDDGGGGFRPLKRSHLAEVIARLQAIDLLAPDELDGALPALDDVELGALRFAPDANRVAPGERARHDGVRQSLPVVLVEPL